MDKNLEGLVNHFGRFLIDDGNACPEDEFTISEVNKEGKNKVIEECVYLKELMDTIGIEIL